MPGDRSGPAGDIDMRFRILVVLGLLLAGGLYGGYVVAQSGGGGPAPMNGCGTDPNGVPKPCP